MRRVRVIPVLLLKDGGLYKSIRFDKYKYIGDPINAVKIFNEKEVDEIVILDIKATAESRVPNIKQLKEIAGEAFMPLAYGGGVKTIDEIKEILYSGVEKVVLNYSAIVNPKLVGDAARIFGSSSIVCSIDYKKDWLGRLKAFTINGTKNTRKDPIELALMMQEMGAGELLLNSIERDGTYNGFDLKMVEEISRCLTIPLVVCGGASSIDDFKLAINAGASAVAAGSMFVFQKPHNAVLISYPTQVELKQKLYS